MENWGKFFKLFYMYEVFYIIEQRLLLIEVFDNWNIFWWITVCSFA